jgi:hypothetical protein
MKIQNLINLNSLRQFVLVIPAVSLLGLAACSGVSGTGEKKQQDTISGSNLPHPN